MQEIFINAMPQETRVAVIENGAVQELHLERSLERGLVGNIYIGKVSRVLPGMQSAFIELGLEKAGFLHVADMWHPHFDGNTQELGAAPPIERLIFQGQTLVVQVIKDPIGTKGARLTTQISIAGRMLVLLPDDSHIGVSIKIEPEEVREQLRQRLVEIVQAHNDSKDGFILRTNAEDASDSELQEDVKFLRCLWQDIQAKAKTLPPGALLYEDLGLLQRVLRDLVTERTQKIKIDSEFEFNQLLAFGKRYMPAEVGKLELFHGDRPIFDYFSIEEELSKAMQRRVELKSGGYLIIDQTEALVTIDVNTGGYIGARNFDETIFKTNLEAACEIARQLRLRNLGGIVIIDFIDMAREDHQSLVLDELRKQLLNDRVKTSVSGFSSLGLLEMTRKRVRESLSHMLCEPCPMCQRKGEIKTVRTICYEILREICREARQFNPKEFRIIASPKVTETFLDEESQFLALLSEQIGKKIFLQADSLMSQEQYDIVLL